ncbi:MAG: hypothetical protein ATN36_01595 [Epulopiscium sp. Nele67-Bin005]|nr:MAG: hypothetical protein ATN36_01595 [Epulopiscium sp. Nele67-Bin005]
MKLNKKLLSTFMICAMSLSLVACGGADEPEVVPNTPAVDAPVSLEDPPPMPQENNQTPQVSQEPLEPFVNDPDATASTNIYNAMLHGVEVTPMIADLEEQLFFDMYKIEPSYLSEYKVVAPTMTGQITEIGVFVVSDYANLPEVTEQVQARLAHIKDEGAFYPSHVEIANEAQVLVYGNIIALVVDPAVEQIVDNFETYFSIN